MKNIFLNWICIEAPSVRRQCFFQTRGNGEEQGPEQLFSCIPTTIWSTSNDFLVAIVVPSAPLASHPIKFILQFTKK